MEQEHAEVTEQNEISASSAPSCSKTAVLHAALHPVTGPWSVMRDLAQAQAATGAFAAVGLAVTAPHVQSRTAQRRAVKRVVEEVAGYLGNTPAIARSSYIDPRVFDRFADGETVRAALARMGADDGAPAIQGPVERAVLRLLASS